MSAPQSGIPVSYSASLGLLIGTCFFVVGAAIALGFGGALMGFGVFVIILAAFNPAVVIDDEAQK